jgi:hypothetical protein
LEGGWAARDPAANISGRSKRATHAGYTPNMCSMIPVLRERAEGYPSGYMSAGWVSEVAVRRGTATSVVHCRSIVSTLMFSPSIEPLTFALIMLAVGLDGLLDRSARLFKASAALELPVASSR